MSGMFDEMNDGCDEQDGYDKVGNYHSIGWNSAFLGFVVRGFMQFTSFTRYLARFHGQKWSKALGTTLDRSLSITALPCLSLQLQHVQVVPLLVFLFASSRPSVSYKTSIPQLPWLWDRANGLNHIAGN